MYSAERFKKELFNVNNDNFNDFALELFFFQSQNNEIYKTYLKLLNVDSLNVRKIEQIPFLPIEFFKHFPVKTGNWVPEQTFESSGTTGLAPSQHFIKDTDLYQKVCWNIFNDHYGDLRDYAVLALLPSYLERNNSSLVNMVDYFIRQSGSEFSGFYLDEFDELHARLIRLRDQKVKTILFGVTFALLDFCREFPLEFEDLIIIETGGMKGRKKEMTRIEVHEVIKAGFSVEMVHSEYGMTELISQAYSLGNGKFSEPFSMKVLIREINDPFSVIYNEKSGAINVIDLANIDSCSFIETKDLGKKDSFGRFEILGRMDNSDIRGCNLLII